MNTVIIGLGSNINPQENIAAAVSIISKQLHVVKVSPLVRTKPIGRKDQDDFLNGTLLAETSFDLRNCKMLMKGIETRLGRSESSDKYGPRTIDLDIIAWNEEIIDSDFYERTFIRDSALKLMPSLSRHVRKEE